MKIRLLLTYILVVVCARNSFAQRFLTDMMDTTTTVGKGIYPIYQEYDRLRFGGYMQPQFQWAEDKGVKNFSGGDFLPNSNNRFMLRRGRIRVDYAHFNQNHQPLAYFAFQFDGTERGVNIRDFWGRFYENKLQLFSLTAGMFARPMGFEVNLSSSDREAPERGRMSQILMKTERDVGMMLTLDVRRKKGFFKPFKLDVGVFNGQGLAGPGDYDSHKDVISRLSMKSRKIKRLGNISVAAAISGYYGGITSQSPWIYKTSGIGVNAQVKGDSTPANVNYATPRHYYGADVQIKIPNRKGFSEIRAEYIRGTQTATAATSETPGSYPVTSTGALVPLYIRSFDGAYFYYLQNLGSEKHQAILKFDWYDPNKKVKNKEVDPARGFTAADVRYNTAGIGYLYYINAHVKMVLFYDWIMNEETGVTGFKRDIKDNIFTCRFQYRF